MCNSRYASTTYFANRLSGQAHARETATSTARRGVHVTWVRHGLELKIIATRIFEKHGPLLSRLAFKTQVRLYDELHSI